MKRAVLVLFAVIAVVPADAQDLELHFIDVGQGDSTLIVCPNGDRILVDAGSSGGLRSAGKNEVNQSIRDHLADPANLSIDVLVITHADRDHYNFLERFLDQTSSQDQIEVGRIVFGGDLDDYTVGNFTEWLEDFGTDHPGELIQPPVSHSDAQATPSPHFDCGAADLWLLAANVPAETSGPRSASNFVKNTTSVVLRVELGSFTAILTGDATFTTEEHIVANYSDATFLDVDILKLGHHCSRTTSTGREWAATTSPTMAFSSASEGNNFGHPSSDVYAVIADYTEHGTAHEHQTRRCQGQRKCETRETDERIYDTSSAETMVVTTDGSGFDLSCERSRGARHRVDRHLRLLVADGRRACGSRSCK